MSASFEERSVWIQLAGVVVILGLYFLVAGRMLAAGVNVVAAYVPVFLVAVALLVVVLVAGHVVAAIASRPESRDERDRLIEWRAEANASWILGVGVLAAVGCLAVEVASVWVAQLLLVSLFLSQVVGYVWQLVYYRRGLRA
jgi:hypothetical protein